MGFLNVLQSLFGNKSTRDMKLIQPIVESVKAVYPQIEALDHDQLRAKTKEIQQYVQDSAKEERAKRDELKAKIEDTPLDEREAIFNQIDKIEKDILEIYEKALDEVLPVAFSIVKETARRFTENEEIVVTANDFDRELATTKDFVRIEDDKAIYSNHWIAGGEGCVFLTDDNGQTWDCQNYWGDEARSAYWYFTAFDDEHPDTVYMAGCLGLHGQKKNACIKIMCSTDGGRSWYESHEIESTRESDRVTDLQQYHDHLLIYAESGVYSVSKADLIVQSTAASAPSLQTR